MPYGEVSFGPISCPYCGRSFWFQDDLKDHLYNDHGFGKRETF